MPLCDWCRAHSNVNDLDPGDHEHGDGLKHGEVCGRCGTVLLDAEEMNDAV